MNGGLMEVQSQLLSSLTVFTNNFNRSNNSATYIQQQLNSALLVNVNTLYNVYARSSFQYFINSVISQIGSIANAACQQTTVTLILIILLGLLPLMLVGEKIHSSEVKERLALRRMFKILPSELLKENKVLMQMMKVDGDGQSFYLGYKKN